MAGQNNLRIIYDNLIDYSTTVLTPSSTQSAYTTAANLKSDVKSQPWRTAANTSSAGTATAVMLADFSGGGSAVAVSGVVAAFTNLSNANATMRIRGYNTPALPVIGGTIATPTVTENTTVTASINAVVYGNGMFFAVGDACRAMYSLDGINWTYSPGMSSAMADNTQNALCIWWSGSKWIVGCTNGYVMVSNDLVSWTKSTSLRGTTWGTAASVVCISRAPNGNFVVGGISGKIATSGDGVIWTYQSGLSGTSWGTGNVNAISNSNGTSIVAVGAAGKVATSADGISWTYQSSLSGTTFGTAVCQAVAWNSSVSKFVVVGNTSKCATSPDGVTWTYQAGLSAATGWASKTPSALVVDTTIGFLVSSTDGRTATSTDGITWTNRTNSMTAINGAAFSSSPTNTWVLVGTTGTSNYSNDTTTWVNSTTATTNAGFTNTAIVDTGYVLACPWNSLTINSSGTIPSGSSAYNYGGGTYARAWIPTAQQLPITAVVIEIIDNFSTWRNGSYIEVAKLIVGKQWTPKFNTGFGLSATIKDLSTQTRTEAGDLFTRRAPRYSSMSFDLKWLNDSDRVNLTQIILGNGLTKSMLISIFPDNSTNWEKERAHQMYGRVTAINGITIDNPFTYGSKLDFEEI